MKNVFIALALFVGVYSGSGQADSTVNVTQICSWDGANGVVWWDNIIFQGDDGNFYGTTQAGGLGYTGGGEPTGGGTVFKVTPDGTANVLLYLPAGSLPTSLVQTESTLYGTCYELPSQGCNQFTIASDGTVDLNPSFTFGTNFDEVKIYFDTGNGIFGDFPSFLTAGHNDTPGGFFGEYMIEGGDAFGGEDFSFESTNDYNFLQIVQDNNQNLEGVGTPSGEDGYHLIQFQHLQIFGVSFPGLKVTADIPLGAGGVYAPQGLLAGVDGNIYGIVQAGGFGLLANGYVYKYSPPPALGAVFQDIHVFQETDGSNPVSLVQSSDGTLYGVTTGYVENGYGLAETRLFTLDPTGKLTSYGFSDASIHGPVFLFWGTDGSLYGFCMEAGPYDCGELIRIDLPPSSPIPAIMSTQPVSQAVLAGMSASVAAFALGTPPFGYQWQQNGANVPNSTNATYTIPTASIASTGNYCCIITNAYGCVTSLVANLTVGMPPQNLRASIVSGQGVQLQLNGTTNFPYVLLSTTNLASLESWQPVITNLADNNGNWTFTDTNSSNYPARFFVITSP